MLTDVFLCYNAFEVRKMFKKSYTWGIYLIFIGYVIYLGITTEMLIAKITFITIGSLVISISCYYEYLKTIYEKMITSLTMETDILLAKKYRQQLLEKDKFKGFKNSVILFDSLLLIDEGNYQECLNHMEKHQRFFRSTIDYLFIYYHHSLICYYFLRDNKRATNQLKKLADFKKMKQKRYSPLFSWEEIDGIRYALAGRNKKSITQFKKVAVKQLNLREQAYLYFMIADCYKELADLSHYGKYRKKAEEVGNTLSLARSSGNEAIQ